jgi:UDP-N-acetylmuramoylalanine--D-glutamate ligase
MEYVEPLGRVVPDRPPLPGGPVLVVGLGRSGVNAARALRLRVARVIACDAGPPEPPVERRLEELGIDVRFESDGVGLLEEVEWLVKSPGVPSDAPVVAAARERGVPVLGELEVGWRLLDNPFIAITGSNGKTTTSELVGHVHREAGVPVEVAGNVGTALTFLVDDLSPTPVVVCEASSFQLEDTQAFAPDAAVLLNLSEDHLDRHGTVAAYHAAKLRIFAHQPEGAVAVVPTALAARASGGQARRVGFGVDDDGAELCARDGRLWWRGTALLATDDLALPGAHNLENAMAAAAVCLARGVDPGAVRTALATFGGVAHRLEMVRTLRGVRYVNDSKATNVASAVVGLTAFRPESVHVILGGRAKGDDLAPLRRAVAERARAVYLIGEAAPALAEALAPTGVPLHHSGDLERAVALARADARPGEVVLLSPAAASYDQYRSFEERGAHFRALVGPSPRTRPG